MSPRTRRIQRASLLAGVFVLSFFVSFFAGTPTASAYCTSAPNACGQTNAGDTVYNGVCSTYSAPYLYTYNITPDRNYAGTYDWLRGGGYNGQSTWTSLNLICQYAGYPGATGAYACASNPYPYVCTSTDKFGTCLSWGYSYYPANSNHGGWGYHLNGQGYCEAGGVQWAQCTYYTPVPTPSNSSCPAPSSSLSISQNPVPYGGNPGFTLSSSNAYYCYVWVDGTYLVNGYTTSGTFYYGSFTSPGSHYAQSYCYNVAWAGSGWTGFYFTVDSPPTSSLSISQNPVPYGGNPGFTLSSSNAYYCYVWVDGSYLLAGYATSGTYYYGAFTSPGSHYAQSYCYNSAWAGSGWTGFYFTVDSPPTSSVSVSPNPVPYGANPGITLSSTNAYYCHVYMDWGNVSSGYFTSGTFYPGALTSPGTHSAETYCYNSQWQNPNGWTVTYFNVDSPPSASITSVSPNPVPYGGNPGFTLSTSNGYYSYILMDGTWAWYVGGYFTSGTYYPGALTSPGGHTAWAYTYNPAWVGSGWSTTPFTVSSPPTSSVSVSPNPVPYGTNPGFTLSSTNGYYCYVQEDGNNLPGTPGYFSSGTFYPGAQTSPGTHTASSYCYNSAWQGSGWTSSNFTVSYSPLSISCSGTPGNPYYGQSVTWSSSVSGGSGTRSYSWTGTDGLSGTTPSVQKSYASSGQKNATVTVTDSIAGTNASATCTTGTNQPNGPTNGGTCTVGVCPGSCTGSLTASPSTVEQGQNVSLTWSVTGGSLCATSCSGSGFNTGGAISGTANASVLPTPPTTSYALTCSGGTYGPPPTTNATVTVLVPTGTITANGQSPSVRVSAGSPNNVTIAWSSSNSVSCSVSKDGAAWQSGLSSGGVSDTVTSQTTYAIDCVNSHGVHGTNSVIVNVLPIYKKF